MNTLADDWRHNRSIMPEQFPTLAETVGMRKLTGYTAPFTAASIEDLLTRYGPLWCAGHWFGPGHIIVLTGVNSTSVTLNDPDGGVRKTRSIHWFNQKLDTFVDGCLMQKDPYRY